MHLRFEHKEAFAGLKVPIPLVRETDFVEGDRGGGKVG